jgi:hypothetical protein
VDVCRVGDPGTARSWTCAGSETLAQRVVRSRELLTQRSAQVSDLAATTDRQVSGITLDQTPLPALGFYGRWQAPTGFASFAGQTKQPSKKPSCLAAIWVHSLGFMLERSQLPKEVIRRRPRSTEIRYSAAGFASAFECRFPTLQKPLHGAGQTFVELPKAVSQ